MVTIKKPLALIQWEKKCKTARNYKKETDTCKAHSVCVTLTKIPRPLFSSSRFFSSAATNTSNCSCDETTDFTHSCCSSFSLQLCLQGRVEARRPSRPPS